MKTKALLSALAVCGMVAAVSPATGSPTDSKNTFGKTKVTHDCGNGDTIVFQGPTKLWPPNHKYRTVTISANESHPAPFSFTDTVSSDEGELAPGSGHTVADAAPPAGGGSGVGPDSASQSHMLRAERTGSGDGRTYTIDVDAKFDAGATDCKATFTVTVPHDLRGGRFN